MGLSIGFGFRQMLICSICEQDMSDHDRSCPQRAIEAIYKTEMHINCPNCHKKNGIALNKNDFFECRDCHSQFSSSPIGDGKKIFLMDKDKDDFIQVINLAEKGEGKFLIDEQYELAKTAKRIAKAKIKSNKSFDLSTVWLFALEELQKKASAQRAQSVRQSLLSKLADSADPNNPAKNRRVEIKVYPLEQQ
jgi:hypothetical protein